VKDSHHGIPGRRLSCLGTCCVPAQDKHNRYACNLQRHFISFPGSLMSQRVSERQRRDSDTDKAGSDAPTPKASPVLRSPFAQHPTRWGIPGRTRSCIVGGLMLGRRYEVRLLFLSDLSRHSNHVHDPRRQCKSIQQQVYIPRCSAVCSARSLVSVGPSLTWQPWRSWQ
jgi:hypothetical protein